MSHNGLFKCCLWLAVILASSSPLCWGKIYQCKDASGRVEFKDSECDKGAAQVREFEPQPVININYGLDQSGYRKSSNLLENGDFTGRTDNWQLHSESIKWTEDMGSQGGGGLFMKASLPPEDGYIHDTKATQCVVLNGSKTYLLSANLLLEKTPQKLLAHRANIVWFQARDCSKGGTFGSYIEPKASIGRQSLKSRPLKPTMDAVAAKIELVQKGTYSNQGYAIWDDIHFSGSSASVAEVPATDRPVGRPFIEGNFVKNDSFKSKLDFWSKGSSVEWDSFTGHNSSGSARTTLRSKKSAMGVGVLNQCVLLGQARQVQLGGYVKINRYGSSQSGGGRLRLSWYDGENCSGKYQAGRKHADVKDVDGWQHLKVDAIDVPPSARAARIQLIQSISGAGVFVLNWDDIYLKAVR